MQLAVEDNKAPSTSSSEVAAQLIDHLKSIGLNVFGRKEIEEFLKEHNISSLQQAVVPFSKNHPYRNNEKATENERKEILTIIKSNKYNKSGTDVVTLDSQNHKTIYLIDHSADNELVENLKEGDGFGIRNTYDIDTITDNDIKEIIRNISAGYGYSKDRILHALQTIGLTKEHLSGIDIDAELQRAIDSNAEISRNNGGRRLHRGNLGRQYNQNSENGRKNESYLGEKGVEFFTTPQGEVYGFVDKEGNIYLDETVISPEHPIHEYTHLWDRATIFEI